MGNQEALRNHVQTPGGGKNAAIFSQIAWGYAVIMWDCAVIMWDCAGLCEKMWLEVGVYKTAVVSTHARSKYCNFGIK